MLLELTRYLMRFDPGFNVFGYLTMRAILGALTALAISFVVGPLMIRHLSHRQIGETKVLDGDRDIHDALGAEDRTLQFMTGDHYLTEPEGARNEVADRISGWLDGSSRPTPRWHATTPASGSRPPTARCPVCGRVSPASDRR